MLTRCVGASPSRLQFILLAHPTNQMHAFMLGMICCCCPLLSKALSLWKLSKLSFYVQASNRIQAVILYVWTIPDSPTQARYAGGKMRDQNFGESTILLVPPVNMSDSAAIDVILQSLRCTQRSLDSSRAWHSRIYHGCGHRDEKNSLVFTCQVIRLAGSFCAGLTPSTF